MEPTLHGLEERALLPLEPTASRSDKQIKPDEMGGGIRTRKHAEIVYFRQKYKVLDSCQWGVVRTTTPGSSREDGFYRDFLMAKPPMPAAEKQDRGHRSHQKKQEQQQDLKA